MEHSHHQSWLELLKKYRAIAVIRSSYPQIALQMAAAVAAGGIKLIEITWNSSQPATLITQLRSLLPECYLGAGTILTTGQLQEAIAAGAQFIFSPHVNQELINMAVNANIPIIPGAMSPTEIVTAWQAGATCVKVFPLQTVGGVSYIKALQGPLGHIPLIPTGGVTLDNAAELLAAGAVAVGLSGELFPPTAIIAQDWQTITQRAKVLSQTVGIQS